MVKKKLAIVAVAVVVVCGVVAMGLAVEREAHAKEEKKDTALLEAIGEITSELEEVNSTLKGLTPEEPEEEEPIEWIGQGGSGLALASLEEMSDDISDASGGRLVLDVRPSGDLCPLNEEFEAVDQGDIDFAVTSTAYWTDQFPAGNLFCRRCGGMSPMEYYLWLISGGGAELAQEMVDDYDVYIVPGGGQMSTPETFLLCKDPITGPADLVDLKMRCAGDCGSILSEMGASTVWLPGGEIYNAMRSGEIDAFEYASPCLDWSFGLHEVAEYVYLSECRAPQSYSPLLVNKDSWSELPDDLRVIVEKLAREQATKYYAEVCQCDIQALENIRAYGCTVERLAESVEDAFLDEAETFYDEQAIEHPGLYADILESQREFQETFREVWPRP